MESEIVIIGAGVVGLAVAARLSHRHEVLVLERRSSIGQGTSSRNSEVLHAGIYYPPGSLKARLCVEGRHEIEALAQAGCVTVRPVGKLIVAQDESEEAALQGLLERGRQNGVEGLRLVSQSELSELEPAVSARSALLSSRTAILDSHGLMQHLRHEAERNGALISCGSEVVGLKRNGAGWQLKLVSHRQDPGPLDEGIVEKLLPDACDESTVDKLGARLVINCAGLSADRIAALAGIHVEAEGLRQYWSRGEYFAPTGSAPTLNHLVYPVPAKEAGGHLGIHATLDLNGGLRFGPSAEWPDPVTLRTEDYSQDCHLLPQFLAAVRRYLPDLTDELAPAGVGLRARISPPNEPARDFAIRDEAKFGLPGILTLAGIESPGLTSAPAIARLVEGLLGN